MNDSNDANEQELNKNRNNNQELLQDDRKDFADNINSINGQNNINSNNDDNSAIGDSSAAMAATSPALNDTNNNANNMANSAEQTSDTAGGVADAASDAANEVVDSAVDGAGSASGGSDPLSAIKTAKNAADEAKDFIKDPYEDYGDDAISGAAKDVADTVVHTGLAVAKGAAGDEVGAAMEVVKIIPSLLRIILPVIFAIVLMIAVFLQAPAMIWSGLTEKYEDWAYKQAGEAITCAVNDACWDTIDGLNDDLSDLIPDFHVKCNQYYDDENNFGDSSEITFDDGSKMMITVDITSASSYNDVKITYIDKNNNCTELIYKNANVLTSDSADFSYTEIINAFTLYRQNLAETNKSVEVYQKFTDELKETIKSAGENIQKEIVNIVAKVTDNEEIAELNAFGDVGDDIDAQIWGLTDTAALYYYINQSDVKENMYSYSYHLGEDTTTSYSSIDKSIASIPTIAESYGYDNYYKVEIDVSTFAANDKVTSSGETYSSLTQDMFSLTDEEMEEVVGMTSISDAIIDVALETTDVEIDEFSEYFAFNPAKIVFENLVGGESVIQKMMSDGLITGNLTEDQVRNIVAAYAQKYVSQQIGITDSSFFISSRNDAFADAFLGTTKYYKKSGKAVEFKESDLPTGEDGIFLSYVFYSTLKVTFSDDLKLRNVLFPDVYDETEKGSDDNKLVLTSSDDYYEYYFVDHPDRAYSLLDSDGNASSKAWAKAFDKSSGGCIQKGDILFFNADTYNPTINIGSSTPFELVQTDYSYQVGMVTSVDYDNQTINVAVYNYDSDPFKEANLDDLTDWLSNKVGTTPLYVENVKIDYKNQTVEPMATISDVVADVFKTDGIDKISYITGYAKPSYNTYVEKYNEAYQEYAAKQSSLLANSAYTGGGTLGYPTTSRTVSAGYPYYSSGSWHGGIDFPVSTGTSVYAADSGTVKVVKYLDYSYGYYIMIEHANGLTTLYAHNSQILVKEGQTVIRGQEIAKSGSTGNSTGPHCHFEVRLNGNQVNPLNYLTDNPVYEYNGTKYIGGKTTISGRATRYCQCSICCGQYYKEGGQATAGGTWVKNGMSPDPRIVACNWLPLGTQIQITIGGTSLGVYTVDDTGGASRLSNVGQIDIFTPDGHSAALTEKQGSCTITIISLPSKYLVQS